MFSSRTDHIANAAKLLTASAAFVAKPGLKTGTSVYDAAQKIFKDPPKGLKTMADDITNIADDVLKGFARDLPDDAPILFEQMVTATLPDAATITAHQMNAARVAQSMRDRLTDRDQRQAPMPDLFVNIVTAAFEKLFVEKDFAADLTPAVYAQLLDGNAEINRGINNLEEKMQSLLDGKISLDEMQIIAASFGEHDISDQPGLVRFLQQKADDYRKLITEVESLKGLSSRIDNIHGAAMAALRKPDLEEARKLIEDAKDIHQQSVLLPALEANEKLVKTQVDIALLQGDVEEAYRLLCASADSFASIDPLEPARLRIQRYWHTLRDYGFRYGGGGLILAFDLIKPCLSVALRSENAMLWSTAQNHAAMALQEQAIRTEGPKGADLLRQAVTAYRAALEVRTRTDHPVDWAMTQNNLGTALMDQGKRTEGSKGADLLEQAVTAYRAVLKVYTRTDHPEDWAMTQNNLGVVLHVQGELTEGPKGVDLLEQSVAAYRAVLKVCTRTDHPEDWAMTQNNLGAALHVQGNRTEGSKGIDLQAQALTAYRAALEVRTRVDLPLDWAKTQSNIAELLNDRGLRFNSKDSGTDLAAALDAVDLALEVLDPKHLSYYHVKTTEIRNQILSKIDALSDPKS
ncbi:MAG: tetratricopeptide repeat protein [Paracoccaceae bacterium]